MDKFSDQMWIRQTLNHSRDVAVPYNFSFTPPIAAALQEHYGQEDIENALALPIRMTGCKSRKPLYASPEEFGEIAEDEFGVKWATNDIDRGSPVRPCLPDPRLCDYHFPDPAAAYRFEDIEEWCARNRAHYRIVWVGDLWERATFMRGMSELLMDLSLHPAFVKELLRGIADYVIETMSILFARFEFEGVALSDDYGAQDSMLMSPSDWRKYVKPLLAEIYALARQNNRIVFHHTCGDVYPIIGDMIDMGLDILHPIQPEAMDIFALKREFGRHLTFCGGVRTQDLLPQGSPREIRNEVRRLKDKMGEGGGFILEPGITLQADVPIDNVIALIEEAMLM